MQSSQENRCCVVMDAMHRSCRVMNLNQRHTGLIEQAHHDGGWL